MYDGVDVGILDELLVAAQGLGHAVLAGECFRPLPVACGHGDHLGQPGASGRLHQGAWGDVRCPRIPILSTAARPRRSPAPR